MSQVEGGQTDVPSPEKQEAVVKAHEGSSGALKEHWARAELGGGAAARSFPPEGQKLWAHTLPWSQ